jgi:hypothetical protein
LAIFHFPNLGASFGQNTKNLEGVPWQIDFSDSRSLFWPFLADLVASFGPFWPKSGFPGVWEQILVASFGHFGQISEPLLAKSRSLFWPFFIFGGGFPFSASFF